MQAIWHVTLVGVMTHTLGTTALEANNQENDCIYVYVYTSYIYLYMFTYIYISEFITRALR